MAQKIYLWIVIGLIIGLIIGVPVGYFVRAPVEVTVTTTVTTVATPTTPTPPKAITLTIEYGEPWKDIIEMALPKFLDAMSAKGITVEVKKIMIPYGVDIVSKESLDFASGTAGDIVVVDSFMIPEYAAAGYLEPLDKYVTAWDDWKYFPEPMKKIVTYKGKVYGVMLDTDVRMIWYRKDIFKIAGLPETWQPTSWEDIISAALTLNAKAEDIKKALGIDEFYPLYIPAGTKWGEATTMQGFYMLLLGGDKDPYNRLYDYDKEKWVCKSTALYRAFKFYYDVYAKHKVGPIEYNFAPDVWSTHRTVFSEGKVAMDIGGSWEWGEGWGPKGIAPLKACKDECAGKTGAEYEECYVACEAKYIGFAKMPGYKGGAEGERAWVTISGGWAITINAKAPAEVKDIAWEFIKIAASRDILAKYAAKFGKVCPRSDAKEVSEYAENAYLVSILEYLKFTDFRDAMPGYSRVSYFVQKVTEDIITKGITPEEALDAYCSLLKEEFGADKVIEYPVKTE